MSQPIIGTTAYNVVVSDPISLTTQAPTATFDAALTASAAVGAVSGAITPAAAEDEADTVYLRESLTVGGAAHDFIVQLVMPIVEAGAETYAFTTVPAGDYTLKAVRATVGDDGTITHADSLSIPAVTVTGSATAAADLQF